MRKKPELTRQKTSRTAPRRNSSGAGRTRTYERMRERTGDDGTPSLSFAKKTAIRLGVCAAIFVMAVILKSADAPAAVTLRETISDTIGATTTAGDIEVFAQSVSSKVGEIAGTTVAVFSGKDDVKKDVGKANEGEAPESGGDAQITAEDASGGADADYGEDAVKNEEKEGLSLSDYAVNVSAKTPMEVVEPLEDLSLYGAATESYDCDTSEARVDLPSNVCNDNLILPIELKVPVDRHVTSKFGARINPVTGKASFHYGIDLGAPEGYCVVAPADGTAARVSYSSAYGNNLTIHHDYGIGTFYGHLSEILVEEGDKVTKGQVVARVGSTGWSTGPHLHFELHKDMMILNPENYFTLKYD